MVRLITIAVLAISVCLGARGEETNVNPFNLWFQVGEEIIYEIHWGVVPVGRTRATTTWIMYDGKPALQIRLITKTRSVMDKIYPVDDLIESVIDPETFLPIRFIKRLKEGRYRADETTLFDFKTRKAQWSSKTNGRQKEFEIDPDTRDIVSFMYYIRKFGFEPGQTNSYRVMADEKIYDLSINAHGVDVLKLPQFGPVPSVKLHPVAAFEGIFVRSGEVTTWVSQDPRRICTRIMAEVPVANVRLNIVEVRGPGDDFWLKPAKP
ncbi:MAG: DUF3108 domain-containing protein [bacterium]